MTSIRDVANKRERLHKDHASSRPLSKDYEYIGLLGEQTLAYLLNTDPDLSPRPGGDGGVDFLVKGHSIDVKTARKAYNLLVEEGHCNASIYVLAKYHDDGDYCTLLGWEYGSTLRSVPPRDVGGYGIMSHAIPVSRLRSMKSLLELLI